MYQIKVFLLYFRENIAMCLCALTFLVREEFHRWNDSLADRLLSVNTLTNLTEKKISGCVYGMNTE